MENINVVDATQEPVVEVPETTPTEPIESVESEVADTPIEKTVQSKEENARFAEVRRKAEQEAVDKTYLEIFGMTKREYEAAQAGMEPEDYEALEIGRQIKQTEKQRQADIDAFVQRFQDKVNDIPDEVIAAWNAGEGNLKDLYVEHQMNNVKTSQQAEFNALKAQIEELQRALGVKQANETNSQAATGSVNGNGTQESDFISAEMFEKNRNDQNWVNKNFNKIVKSRPQWR